MSWHDALLHCTLYDQHDVMAVVYSSFTFTAATEKNADLEVLVDDFATFFVAGMYIPRVHKNERLSKSV